ncbi:MAG TPA: GNAT family N-acetyltransferase [Acidimicrobiales bacterium]
MDDRRTCPACGSDEVQPAGSPPARRAVCGRCGRCWEDGGRGAEVDSLGCPGCPRRGLCESCLSPLARSLTQRHTLPDGEEVAVRPLVYGDRFELAAGFSALSLRSRERRFFDAPETLDAEDLEYLTNIDYHDHYALAALLPGRPPPNGVGVARYVRETGDPSVAEVAVTVLDEHQRRGVGTLLTRALGEVALANGIHTFVSYVLWDNAGAIDLLRETGARVTPAEPGIARVEVDLPARVDEVPDSYLHRLIAGFAERLRSAGERWMARG